MRIAIDPTPPMAAYFAEVATKAESTGGSRKNRFKITPKAFIMEVLCA